MNVNLVSQLHLLAEIAQITNETYKEEAYNKAIDTIAKLPYNIDHTNAPNLTDRKLKNIGKAIVSKINEYLETGTIAEIEIAHNSTTYKAYKSLIKIMGVGPATIKKWIEQQIVDVPSLKQAIKDNVVKLTDVQVIGLRYYDDLNHRIPRDEVTILGTIIESYLKAAANKRDPLRLEICGSYRRGQPSSGDIDIIISQAETDHKHPTILPKFIDSINADPNLIAITSQGPQRVTFIYKSPLSSLARQIDVLYVHPASFITAIVYFTGSAAFNIQMRAIAKSKNYRLNQSGLFHINNLHKPLPLSSESELFDRLDMEYLPPTSR